MVEETGLRCTCGGTACESELCDCDDHGCPAHPPASPPDPREKCGCHIGCHTDPHECDSPCRWPSCLSDEETLGLYGELWPQEERDSYWLDWD